MCSGKLKFISFSQLLRCFCQIPCNFVSISDLCCVRCLFVPPHSSRTISLLIYGVKSVIHNKCNFSLTNKMVNWGQWHISTYLTSDGPSWSLCFCRALKCTNINTRSILVRIHGSQPAIHQANDSAAMIRKRWRYDVDRDSTEQLKGKDIERKRLAMIRARYLQ
jgi:hypothetical protein